MKKLLNRAILGAVVMGAMAFAAPAYAQYGGSPAAPAKQAEKSEKKESKQADTAAPKPGDKAPDFKLMDTEGKEHTLASLRGKVVVLEWFNPECPFVKKHHASNKTMSETFNQFKGRNVVWLAINSGAAGKQGAGKDLNAKIAKDWSLPFPILLDETGVVGRAYGAKRTPEMFVINAEGVIAYRGAIDDNPSPSELGKTNFVAEALKAVLAGETVKTAKTDSYGCTVKY